MRILLVNPPNENMLKTPLPEFVEADRGAVPPLGLLYIGTVARQDGHDVSIVDCQGEGLSYGELSERIASASPDIVGISAMTFTLVDALYAARAAKEVDEGIKVVMGGPHPTIYPKETASFPEVDYAISGEGEYAFRDLVRAIEGGGDTRSVEGVAQADGGDVTFAGRSQLIADLDALPIPDREMVPTQKYWSVIAKRTPVTTMFTSRGCPFRCVFCDRPQMGKVFRAKSAESVLAELEDCERLGIKEVFIYDDTFTIDRERVVEICEKMIERGLDLTFDVRARVNTVDPELLQLMRRAGCERIQYGVESAVPSVLEALNKDITPDQVRDAFKWSRDAGIDTLAYFILGSPTETRADIEKSIDFSCEIGADYTHFTIMMPLPATKLYQMALESGIVDPDVWLDFARAPSADFKPPSWTEILTEQELTELLNKAYRRFYMRPGYLMKRVWKARSPGEFFRKARAGFRLFWQECHNIIS